ncbi:ThiF family, putative [Angomonas deanei]|uniref:ThiF family, putative n=1 Tax=Angomonas deanei TaxID=59799 RepID=A0A7G2CSQ5_9TRYP|nr:ThiF family, putative [Angomonas deanei]
MSQETNASNKQDERYDRQLRLWGKDGQASLLGAHVIALGATASVCECLKTIVLTGVGAITVVDERQVTPDILAENFFVSHPKQGEKEAPSSVAQNVAENLLKLNQNCVCLFSTVTPVQWVEEAVPRIEAGNQTDKGNMIHDYKAFNTWLSEHSEVVGEKDAAQKQKVKETVFLSDVSHPACRAVLVSERYPDHSYVSPLSRCLKRLSVLHEVPLLFLETTGLLGALEPISVNTIVMATAAKNDPVDLRIAQPFPALQEWLEAHNPDTFVDTPCYSTLTEEEKTALHSHIPYISILYHARKRWIATLSGQDGVAAFNVGEVMKQINEMVRRTNPPQENFLEAKENCYKTMWAANDSERLYTGGYLNHHLVKCPSLGAFHGLRILQKKLDICKLAFEEKLQFVVQQDRSLMYYILFAVRHFYEVHKVLPYNNALPDMYSTTEWYEEIKKIFREKHAADCEEVYRFALHQLTVDLFSLQNVNIEVNQSGTPTQLEMKSKEVERKVSDRLHALAQRAVVNVFHICIVEYASNEEDNLILPCEVLLQQTPSKAELISSNMEANLEGLWCRALQRRILSVLQSDPNPDFPNPCLMAAYMAAQEARRRLFLRRATGPATAELPTLFFETLESIIQEPPQDAESGTTNLNTVAVFQAHHEALKKACRELATTFNLASGERYISEIPSLANTVGSMASQELIKLLQGQRYPLVTPLFFSGYTNTAHRVQLL